MQRSRGFLSLVHVEKASEILFIGLGVSMFMVADGYALILLSRMLGIYLLLAAEACTGLIAVVGIVRAYRSSMSRAREKLAADQSPEPEFRRLTCLWAAAAMLIIPGFVTDVLGVMILLPPVKWLVGRWASKLARGRFDEAAEYLRLEQ